MRSDKLKRYLVTFRAERMTYWGAREEARELGLPVTTWLYWVLFAARADFADKDLKGKIQWIRERLDSDADRQFLAAVYSGSDILYGDE